VNNGSRLTTEISPTSKMRQIQVCIQVHWALPFFRPGSSLLSHTHVLKGPRPQVWVLWQGQPTKNEPCVPICFLTI